MNFKYKKEVRASRVRPGTYCASEDGVMMLRENEEEGVVCTINETIMAMNWAYETPTIYIESNHWGMQKTLAELLLDKYKDVMEVFKGKLVAFDEDLHILGAHEALKNDNIYPRSWYGLEELREEVVLPISERGVKDMVKFEVWSPQIFLTNLCALIDDDKFENVIFYANDQRPRYLGEAALPLLGLAIIPYWSAIYRAYPDYALHEFWLGIYRNNEYVFNALKNHRFQPATMKKLGDLLNHDKNR